MHITPTEGLTIEELRELHNTYATELNRLIEEAHKAAEHSTLKFGGARLERNTIPSS